METVSCFFKLCWVGVSRASSSAVATAFGMLGSILLLSPAVHPDEWFEMPGTGGDADCAGSPIETAPCWEFYRDNGTGSYSLQDGRLFATYGPCPHKGRSLHFWPQAVLEGDVTVDVDARLPDEGKLIAFAHGNNRSSGYRGVLYPSGELELIRVDYTGDVVLGSMSLHDFGRLGSVHLSLRTSGDRVSFAAWEHGSYDRAPPLEAVDTRYRAGHAGAGIRHPGYGEYGEFDAIRVVDVTEPGPATVPHAPTFVRGDCNGDGGVDLSDAVCMLDWLFDGANGPECLTALNANGDDGVDIADPVALLGFLFAGGRAPSSPHPDCGVGTLASDQDLGCDAGCAE